MFGRKGGSGKQGGVEVYTAECSEGKEGLVNRAGWKCTLRNVKNFITC